MCKARWNALSYRHIQHTALEIKLGKFGLLLTGVGHITCDVRVQVDLYFGTFSVFALYVTRKVYAKAQSQFDRNKSGCAEFKGIRLR